jgi:pimeloyl-ACP methyl ester carboxylesterase
LGGEPIVLLHGFGTSSFLWRWVGSSLAQAGHTAFAIDLMGYGESDRPLEGDFSLAAQTEYLDAALTALRVPRATMVGVDIGGGVALRMAAMYPARVSRLMLINSVAFDEWPGGDIKAIQHGSARFAFRVARGMLGAAALLQPVLEKSVANPEHMPPKLVARYLAPYVGGDGVTHLLTLASMLRAEDLDELDLRSLRLPTLIVWGEEDRWLNARLADQLTMAIPGSRLARLPGVGRLVPEEAPEVLVELLLEFVGARERPVEEAV